MIDFAMLPAPLRPAVEAMELAAAVRAALERHPVADPWAPGAFADDRTPDLEAALHSIGFGEVVADPDLAPLAAIACFELGRGLAPVAMVDAALGGSPIAAGLVRYAGPGDVGVEIGRGLLRSVRIVASTPRPYGDALAVHEVHATTALETSEGPRAHALLTGWVTASTAYLGGMCAYAVGHAVTHVRTREQFGRPLAALAPVQQLLAGAITAAEGIALLLTAPVTPSALLHAGAAACDVTAVCQQALGAIGFTLEHPAQRAYRRARALAVWADAALLPMLTP